MRATILIATAGLVVASPALAAPPPHQAEVAAWAKAAGYRVAAPVACGGVEEKAVGALGATCWKVKRRKPVPGTRMYPRLVLRLQTFADAAQATRRMAVFRNGIKGLGAAEKEYPLRAGFRLDDRVLIVTTDALAFEQDAYRAAGQLAAQTQGTELTCWLTCPAAPAP